MYLITNLPIFLYIFSIYLKKSIRANQHAETLQAQYTLVTQQRDELAAKLSAAEDRESKKQAALVNLQCALEQFQNGELAIRLLYI